MPSRLEGRTMMIIADDAVEDLTRVFSRPAPLGVAPIVHYAAISRKLRKARVPDAWVDDLAQSVLLTALQRGTRGLEGRGLLRWLLEIARKKAANWHRLYSNFYEVTSLDDLDKEPVD